MTDAGPTLPPDAQVGRVSLRVADLDRVAAFYRDVVGLTAIDRDDERAVLGAGGEPLLELVADPEAPPRGAAETGLFHTAFRVPTRAALGDALARIRDRWRLDGASDHLVSEALYLSDPEDNGVEIYRDRPRDDWPRPAEGRVGMDTLPLDLGALADDATGGEEAPPETTVGHVHLEVSSIDAAREFYVDGVGFGVTQRANGALFLAAGGYHHHVGANTWNGRTEPPTGRGLRWFEVLAPDEEAFEEVRDRLAERGEVRTIGEGIAVRDPDGIELRLRVP